MCALVTVVQTCALPISARLVAHSFADKAFFCNSGAEANEGAVKVARKYWASKGKPEKFRVITFDGAFHGRTLAMLSATNNKKYLEGFGPKVEGRSVARRVGKECSSRY